MSLNRIGVVTIITTAIRNTKRLTVNGETKTIVEWCEQLGANQYTVYYWIREKGITYAERKMSEIA